MKHFFVAISVSAIFALLVFSGFADEAGIEGGAAESKHSAQAAPDIAVAPEPAPSPPSLADLIALGNRRERKRDTPPAANALPELYPCDIALESAAWQWLSPQERLHANGYDLLDKDGNFHGSFYIVDPVFDIAQNLAVYYQRFGELPPTWEDWINYVEHNKLPKEMAAQMNRKVLDITSYHYEELWINPFTGGLIEWNHPEFSAGNCYVQIVNLHPQGKPVVDEYRAMYLGEKEQPEPAGGGSMSGGMMGGSSFIESEETAPPPGAAPPAQDAAAASENSPAPSFPPAEAFDERNPWVAYVRIYGKTGVIHSYVISGMTGTEEKPEPDGGQAEEA